MMRARFLQSSGFSRTSNFGKFAPFTMIRLVYLYPVERLMRMRVVAQFFVRSMIRKAELKWQMKALRRMFQVVRAFSVRSFAMGL
ncbi:hypothetical protein D7Y55_14735 [Stenotrophomonas maltophilia]|nr:hypothetical protein ABW44_19660 [Stenotrophomonas maltophilia]MBA0435836.1 hypothetical protein [Stenotrophomonas maltophilia]